MTKVVLRHGRYLARLSAYGFGATSMPGRYYGDHCRFTAIQQEPDGMEILHDYICDPFYVWQRP